MGEKRTRQENFFLEDRSITHFLHIDAERLGMGCCG